MAEATCAGHSTHLAVSTAEGHTGTCHRHRAAAACCRHAASTAAPPGHSLGSACAGRLGRATDGCDVVENSSQDGAGAQGDGVAPRAEAQQHRACWAPCCAGREIARAACVNMGKASQGQQRVRWMQGALALAAHPSRCHHQAIWATWLAGLTCATQLCVCLPALNEVVLDRQ